MDLREDETAGTFKADRHNDLLSASIGTAEHPGRLRAYSSGYTKVNVYGKGSRRRSHAAERIYEQNQKIQEQSQLLQEQSQQIKKQS